MVLEMKAAEQDLLVWEHTETCQSKDGLNGRDRMLTCRNHTYRVLSSN
jgi:hypothetical protein